MVIFLTDILLDALELCKYTQIAMELYRQCEIEDYGFITKVSFIMCLGCSLLFYYFYLIEDLLVWFAVKIQPTLFV